MKRTSTLFTFPKEHFASMETSLFDEELAILFHKEKLLQPSVASLKVISDHLKKTAKKPNLLLC